MWSKINRQAIVKTGLLVSCLAFLFLLVIITKSTIFKCIISIIPLSVVVIKKADILDIIKNYIRPVYIAFSILLCSAFGCNFYEMNLGLGSTASVSNYIGITHEYFVLFLTVIGVVAAVPAVTVCISYFISISISDFKFQKNKDTLVREGLCKFSAKKSIIIIIIAYLAGVSAILRANFNYIDDMGRVASGYKQWETFSRVISCAFSTFFHMDSYLTDVSPMLQIIALIILAFTGILLLYIIFERTFFSIWELIALIPLALNPYFLECISYKYDAPYMAISVFGGIFPLLFRKKSAIIYILASVIGSVIVCTSYQASTGIYPMIVILLILRMWYAGEPVKRIGIFCLQSVLGFGVGIGFFKFVIMIPANRDVSNALPAIKDFLPNFIENLKDYYVLVKNDFKVWWLFLILAMAVIFVLRCTWSSKQNKAVSFVLASLAVGLFGLLCFGMYPALLLPQYAPRAMYGFGIMITILSIVIAEKGQCFLYKMPAIVLSWTFFVFAFTYGNALYVQKEYTDFRITQVIGDLNDMDVFLADEPVIVQISGRIQQSPILRSMPQDYAMLNRLIPITFRESWGWGLCGFYQYYDLKNVVRDSSIDLTTYNLPIISDHMYHTIRGNDKYILVELK